MINREDVTLKLMVDYLRELSNLSDDELEAHAHSIQGVQDMSDQEWHDIASKVERMMRDEK